MSANARTRRTPARAAAGLLAVLLALVLLPSPAFAAPVPEVPLPPQVDRVDGYEGQVICDPTPKRGALALRDLLWRTYGRQYWAGISRDCDVTWDRGVSEHKDGRAIDWGVNVRNASGAIGWEFVNWATANDGEMARRLGIMYIIWDGLMWRQYDMARGWTEYQSCRSRFTGTSYDTTCHRDHVHISMTWHGADSDTSWYDGTPIVHGTCRAGDPRRADPGSPAAPSILLDPLGAVGTSARCYLGRSIQTLKLPVLGSNRQTVQRLRIAALDMNAPGTTRIWSNAGDSITVGKGQATPLDRDLRIADDGLIYVRTSAGQAGIRLQGLGQSHPIGAGSVQQIAIAGAAGSTVPAGAEAAVVNMTVTAPQGAGYLTLFPCGKERPTASMLNFTAGQTVANTSVAALGADGKLCVYSSAATQIIADVTGAFAAGSTLVPVNPQRLADTRTSGRPLAAGAVLRVPVPGGAAGGAATLNVTTTGPVGPGFLQVFPCAASTSGSSLNYRTGQTVANGVVVGIGEGGAVCVRTSATTHVIVDLGGILPSGSGFTAVPPARLIDTRQSPGVRVAPGADTPVTVPMPGSAAAVNLTVTETGAGGYLTAFPCGTAFPATSSLNYTNGETVANNAVLQLGAGQRICVRSTAPAHVIVDLGGTFAGGGFSALAPFRIFDSRNARP
jgi:hypothetical protein